MGWDDSFAESNMFRWLAHWIPGLVIYTLTPLFLGDGYPLITNVVLIGATVYMIVVGVLAIDSFLNALLSVVESNSIGRDATS